MLIFRIFSRGDANTTLKIQKSINLASKLSNSAFLRDLFDRSGLHLRVRLIVFREVEMSVSILFSTIQPLRRRARSNSFGFSQMNLKEIKSAFQKADECVRACRAESVLNFFLQDENCKSSFIISSLDYDNDSCLCSSSNGKVSQRLLINEVLCIFRSSFAI